MIVIEKRKFTEDQEKDLQNDASKKKLTTAEINDSSGEGLQCKRTNRSYCCFLLF